MSEKEHQASHARSFRKGTHSCYECRRRKVRCIVADDSLSCRNCLSRDTRCITQHAAAGKNLLHDPLQQRIAELEIAVHQLSDKVDNGRPSEETRDVQSKVNHALEVLRREALPSSVDNQDSTTSPSATSGHAEDAGDQGNPTCSRDAPLMSLFDNLILARADTTTTTTSWAGKRVSIKPDEKGRRIVEAFQSSLPQRPVLVTLLAAGRTACYQWAHIFSDIDGCHSDGPYAYGNLLATSLMDNIDRFDSDKIVQIMIAMASTVQQLPRAFEFSNLNLGSNAPDLQQSWISGVESLLASESLFAKSISGLVAAQMLSTYYVDAGRLSRAWSVLRRAISFAYMLGLHKLNPTKPGFDQANFQIWASLWNIERCLSLILGLPSSVSTIHVRALSEPRPALDTKALFDWRLGILFGEVNERNQAFDSPNNYATTLEIDSRCEQAALEIGQAWWSTTVHDILSAEKDSSPDVTQLSDLAVTRMIYMAKFRFHMLRKLLHLPYFIKSMHDTKFEYSRRVTLAASRNLIALMRELETADVPALPRCNLIEYEVFVSAMIILLNLLFREKARTSSLTTHSSSLSSSLPSHTTNGIDQEDATDWAIITGVMESMRDTNRNMKCSVAENALKVLEDLANADRTGLSESGQPFEAVVPYFGKITVAFSPKTNKSESRSNALSTTVPFPPTPTLSERPIARQEVVDVGHDIYATTQSGPLMELDGELEQNALLDVQYWHELSTDWSPAIDLDLSQDWDVIMAEVLDTDQR